MKPITYVLFTHKGEPVVNKSGEPFEYSSHELARIGKRVLQKDRETTGYKIVEVA